MINKNLRNLIVSAVIVIIVLAVAIIKLYLPLNRDLKQMKAEERQLQGRLNKEVTLAQVFVMKDVVDSLKTIRKNLTRKFYPAEELIDLGKSIEKIGKEFGLKMVLITPDYEKLDLILEIGVEPIGLPIEVEFKGSFSQCSRFLDHIEEFSVALRINEVEMIVEEVDSSTLDFTIKGVVFIEGEKESETGEDQKTDLKEKIGETTAT